jgi:hypothetical protein
MTSNSSDVLEISVACGAKLVLPKGVDHNNLAFKQLREATDIILGTAMSMNNKRRI